METGIDFFDIALKVFATSGVAAMVASFLTNARGKNRFIDFALDLVEAVAWNFNKAENKPEA
jgi:hypothetical protein